MEKANNKICGRLCVELNGYLDSPLLIGSGEQKETDADVILDARGIPYIPGSAIAGAIRTYSKKIDCEKDIKELFGASKDEIPGTESDRQSRIFCYDIFLKNAVFGIRDGVRLGENKTAEHKSKYEMQIIERGASFRMRIEIIEREDCLSREKDIDIEKAWKNDLCWVHQWVWGFSEGELRIGAKSRRGFGKLKIESAKVKKFHMEKLAVYLEWLDWNWDNPDAFVDGEIIHVRDNEKGIQRAEHIMETELGIPYTILVRTYNSIFTKGKEMPNYEQLTVGGKGEQAVIPGSSVAGAFRSHIAKIIKRLADMGTWEQAQEKLAHFFGTWVKEENREKELHASKIIFEEMVVDGGHSLPLVRNAIDRFTGGTVEGALYKETPWAGGAVRLRIRWKKDDDQNSNKIICGMLLWAILDLRSGILPIGGETAIGRGIFCNPEERESEIRLDGEALSEEKQAEYMQEAAKWCREGIKDGNTGE